MYDELLAVHTIMRRGTALVSASFERLARGESVDVRALVGATRWLIEFVHHHHESEEALFWPVLRDLFPAAVAELDRLTVEHQALDVELHALTRAVDALAAPAEGVGEHARALAVVGHAALSGLPSVHKVQAILIGHLDEEEPVLRELIPEVPDHEIVRLRNAIIHSAPRTSPHLMFGLMQDPEPVPGYTSMVNDFPPPVRWLRPVLLARYRSTKKALLAPYA
ncbi:hemerythrin domain-containing protein [Streptomyces sp. NPDC051569]|uniref:hemerythrin domain-containing protein n=1 Tax=Streptomyces sp. NPDC051569 TaxID=3365661 RepID=UPI0037B2171D